MTTYSDLLEQAGARHGIPEGLMTQLGGKESSYRPDAVSTKGAVGLAQVMPATYRGMGYTDDQMQHPEYQADAGARYLAQMYQQFGNWRDALQAYHDGPGNMKKTLRGEYTPGPEGRQYVDSRFDEWTRDPATNNAVEQRATSAKVHPQQDPDNPFARIESQATGHAAEPHIQDDPNNPFAQIETQISGQQPALETQKTVPPQVIEPTMLDSAEQAARGLVNIPFDVLQGGASLINAISQGLGGPKVLDDVYRPVDRPTDPYAQAGEAIGGYLTPGVGFAGNMALGSLAEAGNQQGDFAKNAATNAAVNLGAQGVLSGAAKLVGRGVTALRGEIAPEARQAVEFAEKNNVPLLTTDVVQPGTFVGRSAQALGEKIPVTGTGGLRRGQQEARNQLVQKYAQQFDAPAPDEIISSLQRQMSKVKQAAGQRLTEVNDAMRPVGAIDPVRAVASIDKEIASLGRLGSASDAQTISKLQTYRDELSKGADFGLLRDFRTQFRQDVKGDRAVWPNQSQAAVNRVYSALTDDINSAVADNLGAKTAYRYQQANAVYANEARLVNNTRLKNVLQKGELTPEVVNNLLFSNKPSEVRQLYGSLDARGRNAARASVIGKAYEKSGGSPDKFLNEANRLSSQTGILFKGQERQYLNGLTRYLDQTRRASRAGAVTPTGQELFQVAVPAGVASDVLGTGGVGTTTALSYGVLSRAYESKMFRNAMLKLANTKAGSPAYERILNQAADALSVISRGYSSDDR